jgi:two-component system, sensor histidine kinase LadS
VAVIGRHLALFADSSRALTFTDITSSSIAARFRPSASSIPNYNVTRSRVWSRLFVVNHSSVRRWYFECSNPNVNSVQFYLSTPTGTQSASSGFRVFPESRPVKVHDIVFPVDLPRDTAVTCYFALWDVLPLQVNLSAGNADRWIERYELQNFMHGAFFGLLLMLVIYNLFIFIPVRDKVYLYYVVFVIANAWFISFLTGFGIHVPGAARILRSHPALVPYFLGASAVVFSIVFLDLKRIYKTGYKMTVGMFFLLLTVPLLDLLGYKTESIILVQTYGLLFSIISFIFGWIVYRRGNTAAKFYIFGWTAYLIGLIMHICTDLRVLPFNAFTHNSLEIFTAVEAILLSMAVGDKINLFKKEKEQAQQESLEAARKNEQLVREQNVVLAQKVKERTHELEESKKIVEEKNKEILDSINYAQRIQHTLLAHDEILSANLASYFVLFRPKDIVSGDFYWAAEKSGMFYLAVCDSTGHGVPGAFMSLLNISYLNEAVIEKSIPKPNDAIGHVRNRLIESLSMYGGQDGMDGSLLAIRRGAGTIQYAAAHNGVIRVRDGTCEQFEGDKMPIGKGERNDPFLLREIPVRAGDMIYVYTDGFADQFGGPRGKKFKYKQLDDLLTSIAQLDMEEQRVRLERAFEEWKGRLEQVDDVCVLGFRV